MKKSTLVGEACILGVLGELDAALDAFSLAVDDLPPFACCVLLPCFDSLREDARFGELVARLQFPQPTL